MSRTTKIAEGSFAVVYDIGASQVLKRFKDRTSADAVRYEAMMSSHACDAGIPTPAIRAADPEGGTLTFDKIDGPTLVNVVKDKPWTVFWAAREMARLFARIHRVDANAFGAKSLQDQIAAQIQSNDEIPSRVQGGLLAALTAMASMPRLCHFDFHPENVMVDDKGIQVIDWGAAKQGHPMLDITQTVVMNRVDRILQDPGNPPVIVVRLLRKLYIEAFLCFYARFSEDFTYRQVRRDVARLTKPIAAARLASAKPYETVKLKRILGR